MAARVTLRDVSAAANVSTFTASRALSGDGAGVSDDTRARVQAIAAEIGYVPNLHARSLKRQKSLEVAILTANIANQYYATLVDGIQEELEREGYSIFTVDAMRNGDYAVERENHFVSAIMEQRVAAAVITYSLNAKNLKALSTWGIPLIFVDCPAPNNHYSSVNADNFKGSFDVGMHLAGHGYRRWAIVGHTSTWATRAPREAGFRRAAEMAGAKVEVIEGKNSSDAARESIVKYFLNTPQSQWPEAFYATNTVLLRGTFSAIKQMNLSVPQDVAVVAFDDFDWAEMVDPPVTVVDQDITTIGRAAGAILLRQIRRSSPPEIEEITVPPVLRVRKSCGCSFVKARTSEQQTSAPEPEQ